MRMRRTIGFSLALLVVSAPAIAKEAHPAHHHQAPSVKSKPAKSERAIGKSQARRHRTGGKLASRSRIRGRETARRAAAALPPPDEYIGPPLHVVGQREVGTAAWYGGRHVGRRTASGERLDMVHVTAAHRTLPLNSLVRVTNLRNGRSVIATINDRGPVSHSLLIDLSPRAAEQLDMIHSGLATVSIDPVAPTPGQPR